MKQQLIFLFCCCLFSFSSFAQDNSTKLDIKENYSSKDKGAHNISFRVGDALTAIGIQGMYDYSFFNSYFGEDNQIDYWLKDYALGSQISTPVLAISYHYRLLTWLELGGEMSYLGAYQNVYDLHTMDHISTNNFNSVSALVNVKFLWFNRKYISLYSGVSIGASFISNNEYNDETNLQESSFYLFPALSITGIGIEAGADWYGFASIGAGTQGIFCAGFGYRFINKK